MNTLPPLDYARVLAVAAATLCCLMLVSAAMHQTFRAVVHLIALFDRWIAAERHREVMRELRRWHARPTAAPHVPRLAAAMALLLPCTG